MVKIANVFLKFLPEIFNRIKCFPEEHFCFYGCSPIMSGETGSRDDSIRKWGTCRYLCTCKIYKQGVI